MRWEKSGDWASLTRPMSRLRIPCEIYYRQWERVRYKMTILPFARAGLESFMLEAYVRLHELEQKRALEDQIYRTSLAITLVQSFEGAKLTQDMVDRLMVLFYRWHKTVDPGAPKPNARAADDLMEQMKMFEAIFKNQAGLQVMAADPLGLRRQHGAEFGLPDD